MLLNQLGDIRPTPDESIGLWEHASGLRTWTVRKLAVLRRERLYSQGLLRLMALNDALH
jgi:hypothetical protein